MLKEWLTEMDEGLAAIQEEKGLPSPPPHAVNLVVHPSNKRCLGDLELIIEHKVPVLERGTWRDIQANTSLRRGGSARYSLIFLGSIDLLLIFSKILDGDIAKQGGQDAKRS